MFVYIAVIIWFLTLLVFMLIIRKAIDGSRATAQLYELIQEVRLLRKEIKDNKHIIDKRL